MLKNLKIKFKANLILLCFISVLCLIITGFSNVFQKTENTTKSTVVNQYSYALHLSLEEKILENLLTIKKDNKEYKLIPATAFKEHSDYWSDLVTGDKDHIQMFFLNRELLSSEKQNLSLIML